MTNPYTPPAESSASELGPAKGWNSFSRKTYIRVWRIGFGLQLAAYCVLLVLTFIEVNRPYVESMPSNSSDVFNEDLTYLLFNLTVFAFGCISLFGIMKCRDMTIGDKVLATIGSVGLFGVMLFTFLMAAMFIGFSHGFQGE